MNRFQTVGISRFQFLLILQICKDVIELTSRQPVRLRHKKIKIKDKNVLVTDPFDHSCCIYRPLNFGNIKTYSGLENQWGRQ